LGQPCGTLVDLQPRVGCADGSWCKIPSLQQTGTCLAPLPKGSACDDSDDVCEVGSVCIATNVPDASTVVPKVCASFTVARTAGAACSTDGNPIAGSVICDVTRKLTCVGGTCVAAPPGTVGAACKEDDFGNSTCADGLLCIWDGATKISTCTAPKKTGEACNGSPQCELGCDYSTMKCVDHTCG
jgi:hypothetical protein